jgi:hypothetical protein
MALYKSGVFVGKSWTLEWWIDQNSTSILPDEEMPRRCRGSWKLLFNLHWFQGLRWLIYIWVGRLVYERAWKLSEDETHASSLSGNNPTADVREIQPLASPKERSRINAAGFQLVCVCVWTAKRHGIKDTLLFFDHTTLTKLSFPNGWHALSTITPCLMGIRQWNMAICSEAVWAQLSSIWKS